MRESKKLTSVTIKNEGIKVNDNKLKRREMYDLKFKLPSFNVFQMPKAMKT